MAQSPDVRLVRESKFRPLLDQHLPAAAEAAKIGGSGSGIEEVSGTAGLDGTGPSVREFFTTGATTFHANGADVLISSFTALVWRRSASGSWGYQVVPETWTTPAATPDTTPPSAGALAVETADTTATLTVTGASDDRGIASYAWSKDGGETYPSTTTGPKHTFTGLSASTGYSFRHRLTDTAGNTTAGAVVNASTKAARPLTYQESVLLDGPTHFLMLDDAAGAQSLVNLGSDGRTWTNNGLTMQGLGVGKVAPTAARTTGNEMTAYAAAPGPVLAGATSWTVEAVVDVTALVVPNTNRAGIVGAARSEWALRQGNGYHGPAYASLQSKGTQAGWTAHVAAVWNGNKLITYINGVAVGVRDTATPIVETGEVRIGAPVDGDGALSGGIAGVAIYKNKALTPERLTAHAASAGVL